MDKVLILVSNQFCNYFEYINIKTQLRSILQAYVNMALFENFTYAGIDATAEEAWLPTPPDPSGPRSSTRKPRGWSPRYCYLPAAQQEDLPPLQGLPAMMEDCERTQGSELSWVLESLLRLLSPWGGSVPLSSRRKSNHGERWTM